MHRRILALCAVLVLFSACSDKPAAKKAAAATPVPKGAKLSLPSQVLGLQVKAEDISSQLARVKALYFDSVGLFSFRETDNLLRATLQVSRFNELAEPDDPSFRNRIIGTLGASVQPQELRVGDTRVWLTGGNQQIIFVWFQKRGFMVMSVRGDYPFPRTLLRRLLEAGVK